MSKETIVIIKDLIISLLIVIAIVLIVAVFFYDKTTLSTVVPTTEEYSLTEKMQNDINESKIEETQEVVTTYYIDSKELKGYESTKEYDKGKKNPFAKESDSPTNNTNINNSINTSRDSQNFYDDDGTK